MKTTKGPIEVAIGALAIVLVANIPGHQDEISYFYCVRPGNPEKAMEAAIECFERFVTHKLENIEP